MSQNFNSDELNPPDWMNEEFFTTVLQSSKGVDFKAVQEYKIEPATAKGDHYASIMFRGIVQYLNKSGAKQEISLIIKTLPEAGGYKMEFLKDSTIFEVEIEMFRDIIPKFEQLLRSIGDNTRLSADMLYYSLSPRKVIVLQDITKIGFSSIGLRMCTLEEAKMSLDMLAKWHACSLVQNHETSGSLQNFKSGIYNMPGMVDNVAMTKGGERLLTVAKTVPKLQPYVEKIEKIQHLVFERCKKVYELCETQGRVNVLTHGDFHARNLMFKFNPSTKLAESEILVDFQLCIWGSMAMDLLYFMYVGIELETRVEHREELLYGFFQKFLETLKSLNYKGKMPKYRDLQVDMLMLCRIEVMLAFTFLPFILSFEEDPSVEIDDILTNDDYLLKAYASPRYVDNIAVILKEFLHKGFLDSVLEDD